MTSPTPVVIRFSDVTKTYQIQQRAAPRLGSWVVNKLFEYLRREPFDALHGVSFEVHRGEMIGLVGANGAGKSTVLKLTSGITMPSGGKVEVAGKVASLLELGVGFHPELSGMENIFYNGAIMGLSRAQILDRLADIIAFSGLEKFLDEPVKHYSSGMYARLACSVALHVDPDIILVDEILAVGDAEFQQRGMMRILDMHRRGVTILLVTHEISTARDLCDRLIWIDHGVVRAAGLPRDVAGQYMRHMSHFMILPRHFLAGGQVVVAQSSEEKLRHAGMDRWIGRKVPRLVGMRLHGDPPRTGDPVRLVFEIDDCDAAEPYALAICVRWRNGQTLFEDRSPMLVPGANRRVCYDIARWPFLPEEMTVSAALLDGGDPPVVIDRLVDALRFATTAAIWIPLEETVVAPPTVWTVKSEAG